MLVDEPEWPAMINGHISYGKFRIMNEQSCLMGLRPVSNKLRQDAAQSPQRLGALTRPYPN